MALIEVECFQCNGEGEVTSLFKEVVICPNCHGAGRVMAKTRRHRSVQKTQGFVATREPQKKVDPDKDKIVLVSYVDGKDVSHWFCGDEESANENKKKHEAKGRKVEQYTPNEYYQNFPCGFKYQ